MVSVTDTFSLGAPVRIGSRASELAIRQATHVAEALVRSGLREGYELVEIGAHEAGDPSLFAGGQLMTYALRQAVVDGRCDLAVHMLKDLPVAPEPGLEIAAYLPRNDPREALCAREGWTLADLPEGATVGLSSPLRRQQLLEARPDLHVVGIRGSVGSRLDRLVEGDLDATILAFPVLVDLGLTHHVTELLDAATVAPTPGQGTVVVETRDEGLSPSLVRSLRRIDHLPTRLTSTAERALAVHLDGITKAPYGGLASITGSHDEGESRSRLVLTAVVCGPDETRDLRRSRSTMLDDVDTADDAASNLASAVRLGEALAADLAGMGAADLPKQTMERTHHSRRPRVLLPKLGGLAGAAFEEAIRAAGGDPVAVALTETTPAGDAYLDEVLALLPKADRVGLNSADAVHLLDRRAHDRGTSLAEILAETPVAAFGATTGHALVAASVTVDMLPSLDSSVGNLLDVWPAADPGVERPLALLPGSTNATPHLATGLTELGWEVRELAVYTRGTAKPAREHDEALAEGWPEVLIVTSRSVAKAVEELFGLPPDDVRVVAVGRIPARDAVDVGLRVDAVVPSMKPSAIAQVALAGVEARGE
jgi:hydroxymethylbilane synthase